MQLDEFQGAVRHRTTYLSPPLSAGLRLTRPAVNGLLPIPPRSSDTVLLSSTKMQFADHVSLSSSIR